LNLQWTNDGSKVVHNIKNLWFIIWDIFTNTNNTTTILFPTQVVIGNDCTGSCKFNYHTTTTTQVQLRWKVIVLLILMEFMIITVYKLSFHINQRKELFCWKYVFCWELLFILTELEPSWSYGSWIYNYLCNRCLSPLKLWVWTSFMARCTR
jgi:hypothetical protein